MMAFILLLVSVPLALMLSLLLSKPPWLLFSIRPSQCPLVNRNTSTRHITQMILSRSSSVGFTPQFYLPTSPSQKSPPRSPSLLERSLVTFSFLSLLAPLYLCSFYIFLPLRFSHLPLPSANTTFINKYIILGTNCEARRVFVMRKWINMFISISPLGREEFEYENFK